MSESRRQVKGQARGPRLPDTLCFPNYSLSHGEPGRPNKHIKTTSHVEQCSLKISWRQGKDFCTTTAVRSHRESGRKRGAVIRPGLVPWEGTCKSPERSSLWSEWFQPHTGCPRKMRSPGWLEGRRYKQKGCGKPGPHSQGPSTGLLIPEAGQKRQTETTKVSD